MVSLAPRVCVRAQQQVQRLRFWHSEPNGRGCSAQFSQRALKRIFRGASVFMVVHSPPPPPQHSAEPAFSWLSIRPPPPPQQKKVGQNKKVEPDGLKKFFLSWPTVLPPEKKWTPEETKPEQHGAQGTRSPRTLGV